jgi:hypothetical protein
MSDKKQACATYVEQTKVLVTLASAFLLSPAAVIGLIRPTDGLGLVRSQWQAVLGIEGLLIGSVLLGYVVLATLVGTQYEGHYDVYRKATRISSLVQLATFLLAMGLLAYLTNSLAGQRPEGSSKAPLVGTPR